MPKKNSGSKWINLTLTLSNSSLTSKYQLLEPFDKPNIQLFNLKTTSFSSNSGGRVMYTTINIHAFFLFLVKSLILY